MALVSFVLVLLLGPLAAAVTLPMSLAARSQIARAGRGGAGLATAALALSCMYLVAGAVVAALAVITGN
jgi:hypothetical protein